jgi:NTP pyrophosphatase (non-canonical NTP hydrolase)
MIKEILYAIDRLQNILFDEYRLNGYHQMWSRNFKSDINSQEQKIYDIAEVGLINTEVSELLESIRKDIDNQGEEIADIIIRVLNYATRKGIKVSHFINEKNIKNKSRGKLHGKKV